ncbi:PulJ/GspJ family protein [Pedobacter ginsengisoli]|uniref:PulJ/GspJ family protein n=1 Tax=Pedobacter ginsengisoli TaxID=363852 RepID=UPI00254F6BFF|nr:type II secretion system protein [Pedobacter ginsengisoli]
MEKDRIKAFTLIELVLAMMLAAIVMGMAYSAFTVFTRVYGRFHSKNLAHADVQLFRQVLQSDMEKAALIELREGQLNFKDPLSSEALSYSFGTDYLVRTHHSVADTFKMKRLILLSSFENSSVSEGIADRLVFRFEHEGAPVTMTAAKVYTSADLFNYQDSLWRR